MTVNELISELNAWKELWGGETSINIFINQEEVYSIKRITVDISSGLIIEGNKKETYGEFEFSTDDFFKSVLPPCYEPISERDSYNDDF